MIAYSPAWPGVTVCEFGAPEIVRSPGTIAKFATTDKSPLTVTVQALVPEHAPDQPVKLMPPEGEAVSVTAVPSG